MRRGLYFFFFSGKTEESELLDLVHPTVGRVSWQGRRMGEWGRRQRGLLKEDFVGHPDRGRWPKG